VIYSYNLFWALPEQSFSGPSSAEPYFTVSFETPPTWTAKSPYSYPPGIGWPSFIPGHWVPFPSPLTTLRATVEVFQPASTRATEVQVEVNLRPAVSRPDCLGVRSPSGTRDQFFSLLRISFRQLLLCYFVAPSLTRGQVCNLLYNCFWALPEQSLLGRVHGLLGSQIPRCIACSHAALPMVILEISLCTKVTSKYGDLALQVGESQMRQLNIATSSAGLRPKSDCSGKAQKQLYSNL
jgi:hypothetical protein